MEPIGLGSVVSVGRVVAGDEVIEVGTGELARLEGEALVGSQIINPEFLGPRSLGRRLRSKKSSRRSRRSRAVAYRAAHPVRLEPAKSGHSGPRVRRQGWTITAAEFGALSPYLRGHISRFGAYATGELGRHPGAFNPELKEVDFTTPDLTAWAGLPKRRSTQPTSARLPHVAHPRHAVERTPPGRR